MIIDQILLAGPDAYLRNGSEIDLASAPPATGTVKVSERGRVLRVEGIDVLIEARNLLAHFPRRSEAYLTFRVSKEMFPGLHADPYSNRVVTVGGYEDFRRGVSSGFRAMEVEGTPTLVSTRSTLCTWTSPVYGFEAGIGFRGAAWDLAPSLLTADSAFKYSLWLDFWNVDPAPNQLPDASEALATDAVPSQPRAIQGFAIRGRYFRLRFEATVRDEGAFEERHEAGSPGVSIGQPLLRSVALLEPVTSPLAFHSLNELLLECSESSLLGPGDAAPRILTARLELGATLGHGESLAVEVHDDSFDRVECRLAAARLERPPATA